MLFWRIWWALWIIGGFVIPETIALITTRGAGTLSDTIWSWFGVSARESIWHWGALHAFLFLFMIWLLGHITFRIWG